MGTLPVPQACVFDLDGTLVDSLVDVAESLNHCLELLGLPPRSLQECRYMVGEGVPRLCQRAVGASFPHLVDRLADLVRAHYRTRMTRHTRPYSGVPQLIERLRGHGVRALGVLSNKPHEMTVRVVDAFWPRGTFDRVQGFVDERHRKPSPHYLFQMCDAFAVAIRHTWMIGDTPTDVETARVAGAVAIGVTWGFRTRADLAAAGAHRIVDHPDDLPLRPLREAGNLLSQPGMAW